MRAPRGRCGTDRPSARRAASRAARPPRPVRTVWGRSPSRRTGSTEAPSRCFRRFNAAALLARQAVSEFPGVFVPANLGDSRAASDLFAKLAADFDIDGVVNNVGLVRPQRLGEVELSALDEVLRVNLHPALSAIQATLPGMRARGWGRIVDISSLTVLGAVERTAYAAAKAALVSFTRSWALELAATGVTVNAVAPGPTETELFRDNNPPGSEGERRYLSGVPMGRFGTPEEIAAAIAFLLSDDAGFITGQTLHVDGGASVGRASL